MNLEENRCSVSRRDSNTSALTSVAPRALLFCSIALLLPPTLVAQEAHALVRVVATKGAAPEPGASYRAIRRPAACDAADRAVAFRAKIRSGSGAKSGVFVEDDAAAGQTIALDLDALPTIPPSLLRLKGRTREAVAINASGIVVYGGSTTQNLDGVFQSGTSPFVSLTDDPAPGGLTGALDEFGKPDISDAGDVCFQATIDGPGPAASGTPIDEILMCCRGGDMDCHAGSGSAELLVAIEDTAPGPPSRAICELPERIGASSYGIVFVAGTSGDDCTSYPVGALDGVFRIAFGGSLETIALEGDPSPIGGIYSKFASLPQINDSGDVVLVTEVTNPDARDAVLLCETGTSCPGATMPVEIIQTGGFDDSGARLSRFAAPDISNAGEIVFQARYDDVFATPRRGLAIYAYSGGTPTRIAGKKAPAPGPSAGIFRRLFYPDISPGGVITFGAKAKYEAEGGVRAIFVEP